MINSSAHRPDACHSSDHSGRRRSGVRRAAFILVTMLTGYLVVELFAYGGLKFLERDSSFSRLRKRQAAVAEGSEVSPGAQETIHPYLGWIHNPDVAVHENYAGRTIPVNWLGFRDDSVGVYNRGKEEYLIGICGGSVAFQFSWSAEEHLKERLRSHPEIGDRTIRLIRMAQSGFKQPQQLMAYNYLLSLGAEFDLIINIDGFNEATLAVIENGWQQTSLVYPRAWHARTISMVDPKSSADALALLTLRGTRQDRAKAMLSSPLRWSPLRNLIWLIQDHSLHARLLDLGRDVSLRRKRSFVHHGPPPSPTLTFETDRYCREAVAIWQRCSRQLHHLAIANGTKYLHVLQPNQYIPDSKPLSPFELEYCYDPISEIRNVMEAAIPIQRQAATQLARDGVWFTDQTMLFQDISETLYVDPWCHFNADGNRMLCDAIVTELMNRAAE